MGISAKKLRKHKSIVAKRKIKKRIEFQKTRRNYGDRSTIGANAELLVSIDLSKHGYHVFRALSPSAICDLVAVNKERKILLIEVRSSKSGFFVKHGTYDVIALVNNLTGAITYEGNLL